MNKHVWIFLALLLAVACDRAKDASNGEGKPSSPNTGATRLAGVVVTIEGEKHELDTRDGGYETSGGWKIKVEADRVKLADGDQELAKVKKKDDGFKVYRKGADEALLKGKRRGDGYKLAQKPSDREIGRVEKGGGEIGGQPITMSGNQVERDGKVVATVKGDAPATAKALLAVTELTKAERLALFVYVVEVGP